ncbi:hypothetical protein C4D60_Mb01t12570 [Musa balbisiana]|uniref:PRLI-interacting factor A n=1 Tax=Musa balbisiana TaxID=52838 RepID=A0A4S8JN29_MUSBA|nr:hypothetical protein C4D60_Mb01t12570 [Musa balbisiana]
MNDPVAVDEPELRDLAGAGGGGVHGFPNPVPPPPPFAAPGGGQTGSDELKAKKAADMRKKAATISGGVGAGVPLGGGGGAGAGVSATGLRLSTSSSSRTASRLAGFYPKKKFPRSAPFAPRNTTSFIIRAKKSGGIASLVSPCPVTPAVLPTPRFSPTREDLADMVKEEWGVDGYGSMKGLIRLRSPSGHEIRPAVASGGGEEDVEDEEGSSESDVEEHLEVERRLDHDVSRFEMLYPGEEHGLESASYLLESRVDDQDAHIARLEEENLTLKERLFLMEREMGDFRRRLQLLETRCPAREDTDHNNDGSNKKNNGEAAPENEDDAEECSGESNGNPMLE